MITIRKSPTADTRTCDFANVTKETLEKSSAQHILDVQAGMIYLRDILQNQMLWHDQDKLLDIDSFHADFLTGFKKTEWWDRHRRISRHHLTEQDGIPDDVHLIDVLEMIIDCVMAGLARSGSVYPIKISDALLRLAFENTVKMMINNVEVKP